MKPLKILILFLIPLSLFAKEEIDGAFGIKFGQEFPSSSELTVRFDPELPLEGFNIYEYTVTPISKQVHSIRAYLTKNKHSEHSLEQCYDLEKLLNSKYGPAVVDKYLDSNGNSIQLICPPPYVRLGPHEIKIVSKDLLDLAEEERIKLVFEKFKKSGLWWSLISTIDLEFLELAILTIYNIKQGI